MKTRFLMAGLLVAALALFAGGCAADTNKNEMSAAPDGAMGAETTQAVYHALTQDEAKARMDSGDEIIILDVRTQAEYDAGHIAGAILLPNETIASETPAELPDKGAEILVYCRSGNRSAQATKKLAAMGYTAVYDFGGINTWEYGIVTE